MCISGNSWNCSWVFFLLIVVISWHSIRTNLQVKFVKSSFYYFQVCTNYR